MADSAPETPSTLLLRLRSVGTPEDVLLFRALYAGLVARWVRGFRFVGQDPEELTAHALAHLLGAVPKYQRREDVPFRHWLRTVVYHSCVTYCRRNPLWQGLENAPEPMTAPEINEAEEALWRAEIFERVRGLAIEKFSEQTWNAFWEFEMKGRPGKEVAAELGMTPTAVYLAARRVRAWLQELDGLL